MDFHWISANKRCRGNHKQCRLWSSSLIWVCTVCPDLSVRKLRKIVNIFYAITIAISKVTRWFSCHYIYVRFISKLTCRYVYSCVFGHIGLGKQGLLLGCLCHRLTVWLGSTIGACMVFKTSLVDVLVSLRAFRPLWNWVGCLVSLCLSGSLFGQCTVGYVLSVTA